MSKNQSGDAYQVVIDSAAHFADQQGAVGVGEVASKDQAANIDFCIGSDHKTTATPEQVITTGTRLIRLNVQVSDSSVAPGHWFEAVVDSWQIGHWSLQFWIKLLRWG